jgi:hypothetical protein
LRHGAAFMQSMLSKPQLLSWITCDGAHIDPTTGKHTLLGVFSNTRVRQFPFVYPYMVWFITVTDCSQGSHTMKISMGLDAARMQPLIERKFDSESPLQRINLINEIANLPFPEPGEYDINIEIDDELLLATSFFISN